MDRLIKDQREICLWLREQTDGVDLAVAFWGSGAIDALGLTSGREFRVLLDLQAGGSNPSEVEALIKLRPGRVRQVHRLHAKAYIGATSVVVGSANASSNGLGIEGFESTHWSELSLLNEDPVIIQKAKEWFERLWASSSLITKDDLDSARELWKRRRKALAPSGNVKQVLDVAILEPDVLVGRDIFVCASTDGLSPAGTRELQRAEVHHGTALYAYENWPQIPIDATLIAFDVDGQGDEAGISWDVPRIQRTPAVRVRSKLKFVTRTQLLGFELGNLREWKRRLARYRERYPKAWKRDGGVCMEVVEFVRRTQD